ncbi:MAG: VWA containing CoxE family protein, partial [Firmicutes bacterium]|nr:VWA containing CoxE family protein [Bacillota bacterium]
MFLDFFFVLRASGLKVSLHEWMTLLEALEKGLAHSSLLGFYHLCRCVLIKSETEYDRFDQVFESY